jgi:hypothetical protein
MTDEEFARGVAAVRAVYGDTRVLSTTDGIRPLRVAPIPIPKEFWGGGITRLLVVFDLGTHESTRPRGLMGDEWRIAGGGVPHNANAVYEFGEAWQTFSWNFGWSPVLGVLQTVEAYLGRFRDHQ